MIKQKSMYWAMLLTIAILTLVVFACRKDLMSTIGSGGINSSWNMSQFANSSGLIHNHEDDPDKISIFSNDDFQTFFNIIKNGNVSDQRRFTYGLTTALGTTYLLEINDLKKFISFYNNIMADANSAAIFLDGYAELVNKNKSIAQNESALLGLLTSNGVKLMKSSNNMFDDWKIVSKNDGNVELVSCN